MVVVLLFLNAANLLFGVLLIALNLALNLGDFPSSVRTDLFDARTAAYVAIAYLGIYAALYVVVAIGLWRLRRWAWVATMLVLGFGLATAILNYFRGNPDYLSMLLNVLAVFYLNDRDMQQRFARRTREEAPA